MREIYIAGAVRTPIAAFQGALKNISALSLGKVVVQEVLSRTSIPAEAVDEVILGSVLQGGLGQNIARQISIAAGIPISSPAQSVNMVCGSGLRAVVDGARIIALGEAEVVLAGGVESMSQAPYFLSGARSGYSMGDAKLQDMMLLDGLTCAIGHYHMGVTAENLAEKYQISFEEQNRLSYESHKKALAAIAAGSFKEEIVPVEIPQRKGAPTLFSVDERPRETTMEQLARLKPAFKEGGTVTAGNSSGINDGASAMLLLSEAALEKYNITPMAKITAWGYAGTDPAIMGIGPVEAVKKVLHKTGRTLEEFELIEANEAFAAQAIAVGKLLGWYGNELEQRVNISGGAIALGHPIGASGTRILTTLLYGLKRENLKYGLATLCVGGGMGIAVSVERMQ